MKTVSEMIAVMQAYERKEKVERMHPTYGWGKCESPKWNWEDRDYRIAKPEPKKVKLQAWIMPSGMLIWQDMTKVESWSPDCKRVPALDQEVEVEE